MYARTSVELTGLPVDDEDSGTSYTPFIGEDGQVGYRAELGGRTTFIYLNASTGSDDGVATVFLYVGTGGDPGQDEAVAHFETWSRDPKALPV